MDRSEIIVPEASGEAVFSGFKLKWLSAFKMNKMVTRGRLSIHLQEAPKLSKEWGEGQTAQINRRVDMVYSETISLNTKGFSDIIDITPKISSIAEQSVIHDGLVTVFCPGSTAAVTTIEYESGVIRDLQKAIERLIPSDIPYDHDRRWGDGNGFSHVRAAFMKPSLTLPLIQGRLTLGTWQQIVFIDLDNRERQRKLVVQIVG
jgi:secondary thiamine-phosphate synthase enzyme